VARDAAGGMGGAETNVMSKRARRPVRINRFDNITVNAHGRTELWLAASFASSWFRDALVEAQRSKGDMDARRRGILFAVCFVESYLLEWTRDLVGPRDFKKYFPKRRAGIGERWKFVIKALAAEPNPRILSKPSCGGADWPAFIDLVEYRDGLVHANARPERTAARPIPGSSWRHGARFARTCRGRSCAKSTRGCLGDRTRRTPEKTFTFASRRLTSQKSP
jgi:hypothetical protein